MDEARDEVRYKAMESAALAAAGGEVTTPDGKLRAAEELCADLDTMLRAAGVRLPSLAVDPLAYADANPAPLIQLGRCNLDVAHALLDVARTARERTARERTARTRA